jgi:hypothetical protein
MEEQSILFYTSDELKMMECPLARKKNHRAPGYRTADLILNKYDILKEIDYTTEDVLPIPIIKGVDDIGTMNSLIAFSKIFSTSNYSQIVHFYEADKNFVRILHNPRKYVDVLRQFTAVIGPDFSQKVGYPPFVCFENSWWNKAISAFLQSKGVVVIPNVTWSAPESWSYSFSGIPRNSIIAINSTGVLSSSFAKYLWRKGYEEAVRVLHPKLILRYGDIMPGEYVEKSVYFENINLRNLRNGK